MDQVSLTELFSSALIHGTLPSSRNGPFDLLPPPIAHSTAPLRTTLLSVLDEVDQLVAGMENDTHSVVADVRQSRNSHSIIRAPNRKPEDQQHPEWRQ